MFSGCDVRAQPKGWIWVEWNNSRVERLRPWEWERDRQTRCVPSPATNQKRKACIRWEPVRPHRVRRSEFSTLLQRCTVGRFAAKRWRFPHYGCSTMFLGPSICCEFSEQNGETNACTSKFKWWVGRFFSLYSLFQNSLIRKTVYSKVYTKFILKILDTGWNLNISI